MRLLRVTIENFRCYRDPFTVEFEDFTAILGRNDQGKSAIFDALNIFFEEKGGDSGDCSVGGPTEFSITCEFGSLPDSVVIDAANSTSLKQEYLLNERGNLEIKKVFSGASTKLSKTYAICMHPTIPNGNDLLKLKIRELQSRERELGVPTEGVNRSVKAELRQAIWRFLGDLALAETQVELKDEDTKLIWADLARQMPMFALFKSDRPSTDQDAEAQDPMKLAVKEAIESELAELDRIAAVVEEKVTAIAQLTVEKLREMNPGLANGLVPTFKKDPWEKLFKIGLTDDEAIPVNKRGSGVRRMILLNFFRAKVEQRAEQDGRGVILAVEEPETAQHPNHQVMILEALRELTGVGYQVMITTHTPAVARRLPMKSIRFLDCDDHGCRFFHDSDDQLAGRASTSLGVLHDHSVKVFIGVEGPRDEEFWKGISSALHLGDAAVPDLKKLSDEGSLLFIPLGGSTIQLWANRLGGLQVPEIHICDRDAVPPAQAHYQGVVDEMNARPNCKAFITHHREAENYLHPQAIRRVYQEIVVPDPFDPFDHIPDSIARLVHEKTSSKPWDEVTAEKQKEKTGKAKIRLNRDASRLMTAQLLAQTDPQGFIMEVLECIGLVLDGDYSPLN